MIAVRTKVQGEDNDPLAEFKSRGDNTRAKIYLLQVKTESSTLDDALYSLAHPDAPDATPNATHADVVKAVRIVAATHSTFKDIATQLADAYEKEFC